MLNECHGMVGLFWTVFYWWSTVINCADKYIPLHGNVLWNLVEVVFILTYDVLLLLCRAIVTGNQAKFEKYPVESSRVRGKIHVILATIARIKQVQRCCDYPTSNSWVFEMLRTEQQLTGTHPPHWCALDCTGSQLGRLNSQRNVFGWIRCSIDTQIWVKANVQLTLKLWTWLMFNWHWKSYFKLWNQICSGP